MIFINRYCHIQNRSFVSQGRVIYQNSAGSLDNFLDAAFDEFVSAYPKFYKMDHLSKLGFLASEVLLKDISLLDRYTPGQVALVLSNAHSSLDTDIRYFESTKTAASPALFVYTLPNIVAGEICIRQGIKGETAFFIFPVFDAVWMSDYVNLVMAKEKTQACMAGWIDVMGDHHNVFLYLAEKQRNSDALEHTAEQLQKLYDGNYGTLEDGSEKADH